jgi:hypothetical protein
MGTIYPTRVQTTGHPMLLNATFASRTGPPPGGAEANMFLSADTPCIGDSPPRTARAEISCLYSRTIPALVSVARPRNPTLTRLQRSPRPDGGPASSMPLKPPPCPCSIPLGVERFQPFASFSQHISDESRLPPAAVPAAYSRSASKPVQRTPAEAGGNAQGPGSAKPRASMAESVDTLIWNPHCHHASQR